MQHNWNCDNCGTEFYTYCFGKDRGGTIYSTPPNPAEGLEWKDYKDAAKVEIEVMSALIKAYSCTAVTALCDTCINQ